MVKFNLYFNNNVVGPAQQINIGIDQKKLVTGTMPLNNIDFELELDNGWHSLWIELCNKTAENQETVDGKQNDTYIELQNLAIDGSMMNYFLNDNGYVVPDWDHHSDVAEWFIDHQNSIPTKLEKSKFLNLKNTKLV